MTIRLTRKKFLNKQNVEAILNLYTEQMQTAGLISINDEKEAVTGQQKKDNKKAWSVTKWFEATLGVKWGGEIREFPEVSFSTSEWGMKIYKNIEFKLVQAIKACDVNAKEFTLPESGESNNPYILVYELILRTAAFILQNNGKAEQGDMALRALDQFITHINRSGYVDKNSLWARWFGSNFSSFNNFLAIEFPEFISQLKTISDYNRLLNSNEAAFNNLIDVVTKIKEKNEVVTVAYLAPKKISCTKESFANHAYTSVQLVETFQYYQDELKRSNKQEKRKDIICSAKPSNSIIKMDKESYVISEDLIDLVTELNKYSDDEIAKAKVKESVRARLQSHIDAQEFFEIVNLLKKIIIFTGWVGIACGLFNFEVIKEDLKEFSKKIKKSMELAHSVFADSKNERVEALKQSSMYSFTAIEREVQRAVNGINLAADPETLEFIQSEFTSTLCQLQVYGNKRGKKYVNIGKLPKRLMSSSEVKSVAVIDRVTNANSVTIEEVPDDGFAVTASKSDWKMVPKPMNKDPRQATITQLQARLASNPKDEQARQVLNSLHVEIKQEDELQMKMENLIKENKQLKELIKEKDRVIEKNKLQSEDVKKIVPESTDDKQDDYCVYTENSFSFPHEKIKSLLREIKVNRYCDLGLHLGGRMMDTQTKIELANALALNTAIKELSLARTQSYDEGLKAVSLSKSITSLDVSCNGLLAEDAMHLGKSTSITYLNISGNKIDDEGLRALMSNPILISLVVRSNGILGYGLEESACNTTLQYLDISGNKINDESSQLLVGHCKGLTSLALSNNPISDVGIKEIITSDIFKPTITSLDLCGHPVGPEGFKALSASKSLKELAFSFNRLDKESAKELSKNTSLTSLKLYESYEDDRNEMIITILAALQTLTTLCIKHCSVGDKAMKALADSKSIKKLDINVNDSSLLAVLVTNNTLTELRCSNFGTGGYDIADTVKTLASSKTLTHLDLNGGGLRGNKWAIELATNTSIRDLRLAYAYIRDEGAKALADSKTLTSLDLSGNQITDEGAKYLAANTTLTSLRLANNKITDNGAIALASSKTLIRLSIWGNKITSTGEKALKDNKNLKLESSLNFSLISK